LLDQRPALFLHGPLQQRDALRERASHQQRVDAIGDHAKTFGAEVARPLPVAGEKARRLAVLAAGPDQSIDSGMEDRMLPRPVLVQSPHCDQRGGACNEEEAGQQRSLDTPLQVPGEIVEHIGAEGERQTVHVRAALARRENRDHHDRNFQNDRDDEHGSNATV
jgi:hypothetical protein